MTQKPMPPPPGFEQQEETKALTEDETTYILNTTLKPEHREDPNVLRFIGSYMRCRNEAQAARDAGLDPKAGRTLKNRPDIYKCIVALTTKAATKYGFDAHEVVETFKETAFFDPIECIDLASGKWKPLQEMSPEVRRNIKKIKYKNFFEEDPNGMKVWKGEIVEVDFYDKMQAGQMLGREVDLFKEKKVLEREIGENMKEVLLDSGKRGDERFEKAREALVIEARKVPDGEPST